MLEHEEWIFYAEDDLNGAKFILKESPRIAAYLAQQAAEKILKAYLIFKTGSVKRTHDLIELVDLCADHNRDFLELEELAEWLQPFSTKTRYPDSGFHIPDETTMQLLVQDADKIIEFVKYKILINE